MSAIYKGGWRMPEIESFLEGARFLFLLVCLFCFVFVRRCLPLNPLVQALWGIMTTFQCPLLTSTTSTHLVHCLPEPHWIHLYIDNNHQKSHPYIWNIKQRKTCSNKWEYVTFQGQNILSYGDVQIIHPQTKMLYCHGSNFRFSGVKSWISKI